MHYKKAVQGVLSFLAFADGMHAFARIRHPVQGGPALSLDDDDAGKSPGVPRPHFVQSQGVLLLTSKATDHLAIGLNGASRLRGPFSNLSATGVFASNS